MLEACALIEPHLSAAMAQVLDVGRRHRAGAATEAELTEARIEAGRELTALRSAHPAAPGELGPPEECAVLAVLCALEWPLHDPFGAVLAFSTLVNALGDFTAAQTAMLERLFVDCL